MTFLKTKQNVIIEPTRPLYKWAKVYGGVQKKFFIEQITYRREKQIESFIYLNSFSSVNFITDTDVLREAKKKYDNKENPQLLVITDQKFSRYPCHEIINKIKKYLQKYSGIYLCLNRCYINIDNSFIDNSLDDDYVLAIAQWLKKSLTEFTVIDLSLDTLEEGQSFTWVIPDRHFYIKHEADRTL
jgi:hypothetical protein